MRRELSDRIRWFFDVYRDGLDCIINIVMYIVAGLFAIGGVICTAILAYMFLPKVLTIGLIVFAVLFIAGILYRLRP